MIEQEGIKIELKIVDEAMYVMLVSVSGYVDQANCHLLQKTIDKCLGDKYYRLVFNLQKLVYMSSAGWGVLIGEIKRFRENGGDIKLANMGPEIYEIYQMLEFYHIISEYPSIEDALKSFNIKKVNGSEDPVVTEEPPVEEMPVEEEPEEEEIAPEKEIFEPRLFIPRKERKVKKEPVEDEPVSEEETIAEEETLSRTEIVPGRLFSEEEISAEEAAPAKKDVEEPEPKMEEMLKEKPVETRKTAETPRTPGKEIRAGEQKSEALRAEAEKPAEAPYYKENNYIESSADPDESSDDNQEIILEDEIDINIDGLLANEGISTSGVRKDKSNYVEFDPEKHKRRMDIKAMPVPDKIRDIVARNPELKPGEIRRMLSHPDYGGIKISYFKLKSMLKALDLDTKQKRYRFYRSA